MDTNRAQFNFRMEERIMLYSNVAIKSEIRSFEFGEISQICLGEKGRNRQLMALTCPKDTEIKSGMNTGLTIGVTKSGKPRINKHEDDQLFMLLSAKGGYTRRGNGSIQLLQSSTGEDYQILARGRGADGDAGRIGHWDVILLKAPSEGIVRVRTGGAGYGTPSDLFVIHDNQVYHCTPETLQDCCDQLDIELPCSILRDNDGDLVLDQDEWGIV